MAKVDKEQLEKYFMALEDSTQEQITAKIEEYFDNDAIEAIVDHVEEFYGVEDDDELGTLAQLVITGFIAATELNKS